MGILISSFCLLIVFITYIRTRKIYHPLIIFNLWWGINILLSTFGFLEIETPSNLTYFMLLLSIIFFNLPYTFFMHRNPPTINNVQSDEVILTKRNKRILNVIIYITLFVLVIRGINTVGYVMGGGNYSNIRWIYYYTNIVRTSNYGNLIDDLLINTMILFGSIFVPILFFKERNEKIIPFNLILIMILHSLTSGGRVHFIYFIISIIVAFFIYSNEIKFKNNVSLIVGVVGLILIIVLVSGIRSEESLNILDLLRTLIVYFTGSFIYFEKMYPFIFADGNFYYGGILTGGILDIFVLFFNFLGLNITRFTSVLSQYNQSMIGIGGDIKFNAFTTMLYNFMYDFGYAGIVINSILFGFFTFYLYLKFEYNQRFKYTAIYMLVVLIIYESTVRWMPSLIKVWLVVLLIIILDKNKYEKEVKNESSKEKETTQFIF